MGDSIITTILLEDNQSYKMKNDTGQIMHIKTSNKYEGWNRIKNEVNSRYIYFNYEDKLPSVSEVQLNDLDSGKIKMVLMGSDTPYNWRLQYRDLYYYHDYKTMLEVLEKDYPAYYEYLNKELSNSEYYIQFAGIFNKLEFDKIWDWTKEVLTKCEISIPKRCSTYQNNWKEHLIPYLFTIYVEYCKTNIKYSVSNPIILETDKSNKKSDTPNLNSHAPREELIKSLSTLLEQGKVETAANFSLNHLRNRADMHDVYEIFLEYEKERQTKALTTLDKEGSLNRLIKLNKPIPTIKKNLPPKCLYLIGLQLDVRLLLKRLKILDLIVPA